MVRILDSAAGAKFPHRAGPGVRESRREKENDAMHKIALVTLTGLLVALPAAAGVTYTSTMHTEGARGADMTDMTVKVQVSGDKARGDIEQSKSPFFGAGSYEITRDGGGTILLVNPKEKTYFDATSMLRGAMGAMSAMGGMMKMEVSDLAIEKLLEEDGGTVAGLPTTHYRFKTKYTMAMKMAFVNNVSHIETVEDMWATTALSEAGMGLTQGRGMKFGNESFDKLIEAEKGKMKGFPLKVVSLTTTESKGKVDKRTMTREVVDLKTGVTVPDSAFTIPAGYEERSPMPGFPGSNN